MRILLNFILLLVITSHTLKIKAQDITYNSNVRHIIQRGCVNCHRADGYAPFSLETYRDVVKRKQFIRYVVDKKIMPPWKANAHYRDFANNLSLPDSAVQILLKWIDNGCKEGKPAQVTSTHINENKRALPDLVLPMKAPFTVPGINRNIYICYKIPFELPHDTFVKSIEFIPGNKSVVHHASYQILEVDDDVDLHTGPDYFVFDEDTLNRVRDDHDYRYFGLLSKSGKQPREMYHGGWLPGTSAQVYPPYIGFRLPRRGVLLIRNFHYSPTPVEQKDLSRFHIYYSPFPPDRTIGFAAFKPRNPAPDGKWYIKAGDSAFHAHINVRFHNDVSVLNINPHMHRLGKYFNAYAITPSGDTIKLVEILQWDFNWQEFYRFKTMVKIPAGSVLHADAIYDNSAANPDNPYSPPQNVLFEWGMNDDSEMMRLVLLYLPYLEGDEFISLE